MIACLGRRLLSLWYPERRSSPRASSWPTLQRTESKRNWRSRTYNNSLVDSGSKFNSNARHFAEIVSNGTNNVTIERESEPTSRLCPSFSIFSVDGLGGSFTLLPLDFEYCCLSWTLVELKRCKILWVDIISVWKKKAERKKSALNYRFAICFRPSMVVCEMCECRRDGAIAIHMDIGYREGFLLPFSFNLAEITEFGVWVRGGKAWRAVGNVFTIYTFGGNEN